MLYMSISVKLRDENNNPYGVKNVKGKIRTSSMPYTYDISELNVPGHTALNKFGHNNAVGTAYEDIWSGSAIYPFLTSAARLEVTASLASDEVAKNGARTVWLNGLDSSYNVLSETVSMSGTSPVTTTNTFLRIHRAKVVTAGNSGSNVGAIEIKASGGAVLALIEAEMGQTLMAVWTVPSGQTFYMTEWYASSAVTKAIDMGLWVRDNTVADAAFQNKQFVNFTLDTFTRHLSLPLRITQKTDMVLRAKVGVAGGDVSGGFSG